MKSYSYDEARSASLAYFEGDELAADVFVSKYALRLPDGSLAELTPDDMHRRLAREFARIEARYPNPLGEEAIYEAFAGFRRIVAQGSPMSGVGNTTQVQSLSNCYVISSPLDAYGSIARADEEILQIQKRRGGVGVDLSNIRPRETIVQNAARTADGIPIFMERYSNTTREVAQGGRRGALMETLDVRHPDIELFIDAKLDSKKVTGANVSVRITDSFMQAVSTGSDFELQWPVDVPIEQAKVRRTIKATELWKRMMHAAWKAAEPGVLYWDTVINWSMADEFADKGFRTVCTNPCLTGDTLVAVADARKFVSIKQLADEGRDVSVYARDLGTNRVIVRTMRNPHMTRTNAPVYRVMLENGHDFKATGDHKIPLLDDRIVEVSDLMQGDQLHTARRGSKTLAEVMKAKPTNPSQYVFWRDCKGYQSEHRMVWEATHGVIPVGNVIHHVNFDSTDNSIDNLACMSEADHKELHAARMRGENNPVFKVKADPLAYAQWTSKLSEASTGTANGNAFDVSNDELMTHIRKLTTSLGRRISKGDWLAYALVNGLPRFMNEFRTGSEGMYQLFINVAKTLGIKDELVALDTRTARRWIEAELQDYQCRMDGVVLQVERTCEWCETCFWQRYTDRNVAFCSISCANNHVNTTTDTNQRRTTSVNATFAAKGEVSKRQVLDVYTQLRLDLGREPLQREVTAACRTNHVPFRGGTKHGFKSWSEVKEAAQVHNHRVVSVEFVGYEDVYNGSVDEVHNFMVGGWDVENGEHAVVNVMNCSELPLSAYDSCRLLLINVLTYVKNPFLGTAAFDFIAFHQDAMKAQRLMDDLIDLEIEAIDRIIAKVEADPEPVEEKARELRLWQKVRQSCVNGRRTGTGVTAVGDAVAAMGLTYGSPEAIVFVEAVYQQLAVSTHTSSVQMAKERGAFPAWEPGRYKQNLFANRLRNACTADVNESFDQVGRRNIALTTTAPAGSVSILTQTTSGIEPAYMLNYKRRKKLTGDEIRNGAQVDFIDPLGDNWQEHIVYHPGVKTWMQVTGKQDIEQSPYWKATSNDVDWLASVDLLAAAQKWTEHSISKTINLPSTVTEELVSEVYLRAWKLGIKGVTVYRDGSRTGVLLDAGDKKDEKQARTAAVIDHHAPTRPHSLPCDIHRVKIRGEQYLVLVGLMNNRPYEVFAGLSERIEVPRKHVAGSLIKNGKKEGVATYNLSIPFGDDDDLIIKDVVSMFDNPTYGAFTRTISLALRHGVPVQYLVEQLRKDKHSDMQSFNTIIARVLKGYIPDGTKVTIEKTCPDCSSTNLSYQSGCSTCVDCGSSKCG